jgi:hypothetical protein
MLCFSIFFSSFTNSDGLAHTTIFTPPLFIEGHVRSQESERSLYLCARSIDIASSNDFAIGFWNCSNSVFFSVFFYLFIEEILNTLLQTAFHLTGQK